MVIDLTEPKLTFDKAPEALQGNSVAILLALDHRNDSRPTAGLGLFEAASAGFAQGLEAIFLTYDRLEIRLVNSKLAIKKTHQALASLCSWSA